MCYLCRTNLNSSPEQVILYSCVGINGLQAKQFALDELKKFITWDATNMNSMLHPNVLVNLHTWCTQFTNPNSLTNDELVGLLERKIHEFKRIQENWELGISMGAWLAIGVVAASIYWKNKK